MSLKGKYGYYRNSTDYIMYWPDESGWYVNNSFEEIWLKGGDGWDQPQEELKGAALVAPLSILFWEDE